MTDRLAAITFDFGNTLVPFPAGPMDNVVHRTAERAAVLVGCAIDAFLQTWAEERRRQFEEDVPEGREADMDVRVVRVVARLRGHSAPTDGARWDDATLALDSDPREVESILSAYANAFVDNTPVPAEIGSMLERLARYRPLAIVSNWPLSASIDRFVEAAGWGRYLTAVVVSHRVGFVKPRPEIFLAAARELGVPSGPSILHVGDDIGADVLGAQNLGWRTGWVRQKPADSPLPLAAPAPGIRPDITVDSVLEIEAAIDSAGGLRAK
jgi:FMN phosphatase YigB (HAD superfamily)